MASRFVHPYYILNSLLIVAYVVLRIYRLSSFQLAHQDMFGISREAQIYFCLSLMLVTRALSAPTIDAYISSAFNFARVTVLICLWYMDVTMGIIFLALWVAIYAICPQPRYQLPDSVVTLTTPSFNERIRRNKQRAIYIVWCHAAWSSRCSQLTPVLAALAKSFEHPRIRFARLDVSKCPDAAHFLKVATTAMSKQLPCVIAFKQGVEVGRIPVIDRVGNVPKEFARGFTPSDVMDRLQFTDLYKTAVEWEHEAQVQYSKKRNS